MLFLDKSIEDKETLTGNSVVYDTYLFRKDIDDAIGRFIEKGYGREYVKNLLKVYCL